MATNALKQYTACDTKWVSELPLHHKIVVKLFRRLFNRVIKHVLCRGLERGTVNSIHFHDLVAICDRVLWPERYTTELKEKVYPPVSPISFEQLSKLMSEHK